ncbi:hypothetical protein FRB90_012743 [Tulasnella sp. 427]|nr:hypothetical protein FRB90_012743 [Tulasnella sp. 427]
MNLPPLPSDAIRPPVSQSIREWLAKVMGLEILPISPGPRVTLSVLDTLFYGDLGDIRWDEVTTMPNFKVLFPLRGNTFQIRMALNCIDTLAGGALDTEPFDDDLSAIDTVRQRLASARPINLQRDVPEVMEGLRLHLGNPGAKALLSYEAQVVAYDGWWASAGRPDTKSYEFVWRQYLALSVHPNPWLWTSFPDTELRSTPIIVQLLDPVQAALGKALARTTVAPKEVEAWHRRFVCFHPFAARGHATDSCEYRCQDVGHALVMILTWIDPENVTIEDRNARAHAIEEAKWSDYEFGEGGAMAPNARKVSQWYHCVTSPGSVIAMLLYGDRDNHDGNPQDTQTLAAIVRSFPTSCPEDQPQYEPIFNQFVNDVSAVCAKYPSPRSLERVLS